MTDFTYPEKPSMGWEDIGIEWPKINGMPIDGLYLEAERTKTWFNELPIGPHTSIVKMNDKPLVRCCGEFAERTNFERAGDSEWRRSTFWCHRCSNEVEFVWIYCSREEAKVPDDSQLLIDSLEGVRRIAAKPWITIITRLAAANAEIARLTREMDDKVRTPAQEQEYIDGRENFACACVGCANDEPFCGCEMSFLGVYREGEYWVVPCHYIPVDKSKRGWLGGMSWEQQLENLPLKERLKAYAKLRDPKRLP